MALEDELEPKLNEISRLAHEWYAKHLRQYGWEFNRYGNPAEHPDGPPIGAFPASPQAMQQEWESFRDNLNRLLTQFRNFYGNQDIYWLHERLGGSMADVGDGFGSTVHDRLFLAYDPWGLDVAQLVETQDWAGSAAGAFDQQFNKPFRRSAGLHLAYVRALAIAARTYHDVLVEMHKALLAIADACVDSLRNPRGWDVVYILSGLSIVGGYVGMYVPPIGWASLAIAGVTFAMTEISRDTTTPAEIQLGIGGANAPDTIQSTYEALIVVEQELDKADGRLAAALDQDLKSKVAFDHPDLQLPRPAVATGEPAFTQMTRDSAPGVPLAKNEVVVSIVALYRAGKVNLAIAAEQYDAAAAALGSCSAPAPLIRFFPRSVPKFDQALDLLLSVLKDTAATLTDVGAALVQMADSYRTTDERRAEINRQIAAIDVPWVGDEPQRAGGV